MGQVIPERELSRERGPASHIFGHPDGSRLLQILTISLTNVLTPCSSEALSQKGSCCPPLFLLDLLSLPELACSSVPHVGADMELEVQTSKWEPQANEAKVVYASLKRLSPERPCSGLGQMLCKHQLAGQEWGTPEDRRTRSNFLLCLEKESEAPVKKIVGMKKRDPI